MAQLAKLIEALLQPLGLIWMIHVSATVVLAWRRKWRGAIFFGCIATSIWVIGSTSIPGRLLASLERPYRDQQLERIPKSDAVVMLGGVLDPSKNDLLGFDIGDAADRVLTAVELVRQGKANNLVLGGGSGHMKTPEGAPWQENQIVERWLKGWGLAPTNCFPLGHSLNTRDEAVQVATLAKEKGWRRVILVTSAAHMQRAEGLFRRLDMNVIPVACDFQGLNSLEIDRPFNPFPRLGGFHHLELYLHEKIGLLYYRLREWVG